MFIVNLLPSFRLFDDGSCVIRCQLGRYAMERQCHLCHHTCKECSDQGPEHCTSCDTGTLPGPELKTLFLNDERLRQPKHRDDFPYTGSVSADFLKYDIRYL